MTVNQVFYNHLLNNSSMQSAFNKLFYIINDRKTKEPYAVIYQLDDPGEVNNICVEDDDQGQARFACEVYTKAYTDGVDKRRIFKDAVKELESTTNSNIKIYRVKLENTADRTTRVNGLFLFSFETVIWWELDT